MGCRFNVDSGDTVINVAPTKISGRNEFSEAMMILGNVIKGEYGAGVTLNGDSYWLEDITVANNAFISTADADPGAPRAHINVRGSRVNAHIDNNSFAEQGRFQGLTDINSIPQYGHYNRTNTEAAGAGQRPSARRYPVGTMIENTDDGTVWLKKPDGELVRIAG
jgi:hypothetical protein